MDRTKPTEYDDDDIAQCPVLKDQLGNLTAEQKKELRKKYDSIVKPMMRKKEAQMEEEKKERPQKEEKKKVRKQHPRFEKYKQSQGSCPFMNTKLIEPNDKVFEFGYNLRYKSRYDFLFNYRGKDSRAEFRSKRKEFDKYPIFLKHTLLHPEGINKVRNADFGNAFFVFDDIKTEGNLYYEDEEFYTALDYYEQAYSCFQWLEFTDPERKDGVFKNFDLKPIYDHDVVRKEKDYKGDECEIDTRLAAVVNILLNMCCAYMRLCHYFEALQCCNEILRLTDLSCEAYFRRSQIRTYNLKSTFKDLDLAEEDIMTAIKKKPEEEKYKEHLEILKKKRSEKLDDDKKFVSDLLHYAKKCVEFKKSREIDTSETLVEMPQEIKIMRVIKSKYSDCMEFFRDTEDNKQVLLTLKDFREFSITSYQKMMRYFKFDPSSLEPILLQELEVEQRILLNDELIQREINTLKIREALMLFGEGHINFELFQYATKLVIKEEKKKREMMEKKQREMTGLGEKKTSTSYAKLAIYGIVISLLLYVLWNWIVWRFFWAGKGGRKDQEFLFGHK